MEHKRNSTPSAASASLLGQLLNQPVGRSAFKRATPACIRPGSSGRFLPSKRGTSSKPPDDLRFGFPCNAVGCCRAPRTTSRLTETVFASKTASSAGCLSPGPIRSSSSVNGRPTRAEIFMPYGDRTTELRASASLFFAEVPPSIRPGKACPRSCVTDLWLRAASRGVMRSPELSRSFIDVSITTPKL